MFAQEVQVYECGIDSLKSEHQNVSIQTQEKTLKGSLKDSQIFTFFQVLWHEIKTVCRKNNRPILSL